MGAGAAMTEMQARLFALQDAGYRDFNSRLIPTVDPERVIGVRTPALRSLAKELRGGGQAERFLRELPHFYFEENQLHAFLIASLREFGKAMEAVEEFLPYVDNWATCDQLSPAAFKKDLPALESACVKWLRSDRVYTVRFGIGMLMRHFLDEGFTPACLDLVGGVSSGEYYINMMIAWYFATALAKQYDSALPWLEQRRLGQWVHNKTIQKAVESYRITPEQKDHLRTLRWK